MLKDEYKVYEEKTFNHRVGVVGGISIIGTSGIVQPFSNEAFIDAIRREVQVAVATGIRQDSVVGFRYGNVGGNRFRYECRWCRLTG